MNENVIKNLLTLAVLIFAFFIGIMLILQSNSWNLGSIQSMNLAGAIISIFSGTGLLIKLYINERKKKI